MGHWVPGVHHMVACCDRPHVPSEQERADLEALMEKHFKIKRQRNPVAHLDEDRDKSGLRERACTECNGNGGACYDILDGWEDCSACWGKGKVLRAPRPW